MIDYFLCKERDIGITAAIPVKDEVPADIAKVEE